MKIFMKLTLLAVSCVSLNGFCNDMPKDYLKLDVSTSYIYTGSAQFKEAMYERHKLSYRSSKTTINYDYELDDDLSLIGNLGFQANYFGWSINPYYDKSVYSDIILNVGMKNNNVDGWLLTGIFGLQLDADSMNLNKKAIYNATFAGTYNYSDNIDFHMGLIGSTGIRKNNIKPILGIKYMHEDWTFNAIFPIDISAKYNSSEKLAYKISLEPFYHRHRLDQNAASKNGIIEYRAKAIKTEVIYDVSDKICATANVGYNFGGDLKCRDENGNNPVHYKFKAKPFAGVNISIKL